MTLIRVTAKHFVAGLIVENDIVIQAAPILRYTIGWTSERTQAYFAKRKWFAEIVE